VEVRLASFKLLLLIDLQVVCPENAEMAVEIAMVAALILLSGVSLVEH
jgi:hypothetical protein